MKITVTRNEKALVIDALAYWRGCISQIPKAGTHTKSLIQELTNLLDKLQPTPGAK
jgi:hypothetical protein